MFSLAVSIGSRLKNWNTKPMWVRLNFVRGVSARVVIVVPAIDTSPVVGLSRPARMCMRVDLPEPEGPMTAVSLPRSISRVTPLSACTAVSPSPYTRVTSLATTTAPSTFPPLPRFP